MLLGELKGVEPPLDIEERRSEIRDYLIMKSDEPDTDPATQQFNRQYISAWDELKVIGELSDILLSDSKKPNMQYIGEFLPRAFVALALRQPEYADHLHRTGDVSPAFTWLQEDEEAQFYLSLNIGNNIQSNIGKRYWFLGWALQTLNLTDDRIVLEYGTSGQAIGKQWTEVIEGKRKPHKVQMWQRQKNNTGEYLTKDQFSTEYMHNVTSQRFPAVPRYYGLDVVDPQDLAVRSWIRACSQYLTDWTDPVKRAEYEALEKSQPSNVHFQQADFSTYTIDTYRRDFPGEERPKAIYPPFSIYELETDEERKNTLTQAVEIVTDAETQHNPNTSGGIVAILDDIQSISPDFEVVMHEERRRDFSTCGGWLYYSKLPELGFQKYYSFKNGRLDDGIPEYGFAMTALQEAGARRR
jgi:hypothetical protein